MPQKWQVLMDGWQASRLAVLVTVQDQMMTIAPTQLPGLPLIDRRMTLRFGVLLAVLSPFVCQGDVATSFRQSVL